MKFYLLVLMLVVTGCSTNTQMQKIDCFEVPLSDIELMECVEKQRFSTEEDLEEIFNDKLSETPSVKRNQLELAQAAWWNYAARFCELNFYGANESSFRHIENNLCLTKLAERRASFLRVIYSPDEEQLQNNQTP